MFKLWNDTTKNTVRDSITNKELLFSDRKEAEEFGRKLQLMHIDKGVYRYQAINVDMFAGLANCPIRFRCHRLI